MLSCPAVYFEWTIEVLVGYHLQEPFLGIMLDKKPRPTHSKLQTIFQNLYKQMTCQDDCGKVYWVYSEENSECYKRQFFLDMCPLVSLAKNIRKEPVFALLNKVMIESISSDLYIGSNNLDTRI